MAPARRRLWRQRSGTQQPLPSGGSHLDPPSRPGRTPLRRSGHRVDGRRDQARLRRGGQSASTRLLDREPGGPPRRGRAGRRRDPRGHADAAGSGRVPDGSPRGRTDRPIRRHRRGGHRHFGCGFGSGKRRTAHDLRVRNGPRAGGGLPAPRRVSRLDGRSPGTDAGGSGPAAGCASRGGAGAHAGPAWSRALAPGPRPGLGLVSGRGFRMGALSGGSLVSHPVRLHLDLLRLLGLGALPLRSLGAWPLRLVLGPRVRLVAGVGLLGLRARLGRLDAAQLLRLPGLLLRKPLPLRLPPLRRACRPAGHCRRGQAPGAGSRPGRRSLRAPGPRTGSSPSVELHAPGRHGRPGLENPARRLPSR